MFKNVASQKWVVFAFDETDNTAKTGDAANISGNLRLDGAAANAIDDTNPTELEDGYYIFDITQAESNADYILICPASSTANIQVIGCPAAVFTRPPNFNELGIESDGDLTKVNTLDGHTAQTGDSYAVVSHTDYGNAKLVRSTTPANTLDVSATGEAGLDFDNIKDATGAHTLTNITVPTVTTNTDMRGTDNAATEAKQDIIDTNVDSILVDTGTTLDALIKDVPTVAEFEARTLSSADYVVTTDTIAGVTTVTNLTNAPTNGDLTATMKASVNAEVDTALTDYDPPTKAEMDSAFTEIKGATWAAGTDTLEAIRDRGDAAWTTGAGGSDRLLMVDTTIATLATQTSFTLTSGSADDNAYNNCTIVIEDASTATQKAVGLISDYTGGTKTITLKYDPGIFTMAVSDKVYILAENALKSTDANRQLDVTATGAAGIDWGNVENKTTANDLSATDIQLVDTCTTNTDMRGTDSAATEAKQDILDTNVDTLLTRLSAARAGYLDELNVATGAKTAWYVKKGFIALVNKKIFTEANGNLEQFDDSDVSIGSIAAAVTSDGTYTTQKRAVQ